MGRSEHANTVLVVVLGDLNVRNTVGCVPSVTFFLSVMAPTMLKQTQCCDTR